MKTIEKKVYLCDHCGKLYRKPSMCLKHEETCLKNPKNHRECWNCKHISKRNIAYMHPVKNTVNVSLFFCSKKDVFLYPVNPKKKPANIPGYKNIEMMDGCHFYHEDNNRLKKNLIPPYPEDLIIET